MASPELESTARTPLAATARALPYGQQLFVFSLLAIVSFFASALSLSMFMASDFVQGTLGRNGGPVRGYEWWQLLAICIWMVAGPIAIGSSMKAALIAYKLPEATRRSRSLTAGVLCVGNVGIALAGAFWLKASELIECGYLWCFDAESSTVDPNGFKASVGSEVFFVAMLIALLAAALMMRVLAESSVEKASSSQMMTSMRRAERAHIIKQHVAGLALLLCIPMMLVVTGLLPNTWERFSRSTHEPQAMHSLKYFMSATMGIDGDMMSEKPGAWMVTQNWRLSENVVVKFFPDTVLFYGFLEGIVLVTIVHARSGLARRVLSHKLRGISTGRALLGLWFLTFLVLFIWYWSHDHLFHGDGKYDTGIEVPARVTGLVALMALGLLLLPASKSSPILVAAGVSWESALWVHISLGMLFLLACICHVALYFIQFVKLGHGLDVLPFNALFWYPQNPVGGNKPSDNWTVPMMATVFWPSIAIFGLFPWMRRKHYELFRYSHNFFMVLIPAAFWHATHAWYFLLPGVTLWMLDRFLRFLNATECVTLYDYAAHSVDCWTDPRSDRPSQNMPEKITKLSFTWPGQTRVHSSGMYVLVNLPQVSVSEWHPFSLSSSPLDSVASLHIKNMGEDSFTGKLHSIMSQNPKQSDIVMNIQGPYGPRIDLHSVPQVLLVAGGIGVTPMVNTLRCAAQRARAGKAGVLKRLHLVWSARSADVFSVFHDELALDLKELSIDVQISLYCSTLQEARVSSLGVINSGMPRFPEILAAEAGLGHCLVRVCGPPPMVDACTEAAKAFKEKLDFEPWSFAL